MKMKLEQFLQGTSARCIAVIVCWVAVVLLLPTGAFAQIKQLAGTISDENNTVLPGVSVSEKNTRNSVQADAKGKFSIAVKPGAVLVISMLDI